MKDEHDQQWYWGSAWPRLQLFTFVPVVHLPIYLGAAEWDRYDPWWMPRGLHCLHASPGWSLRHTPIGRPGSQQVPQQQFCSEVAMEFHLQVLTVFHHLLEIRDVVWTWFDVKTDSQGKDQDGTPFSLYPMLFFSNLIETLFYCLCAYSLD